MKGKASVLTHKPFRSHRHSENGQSVVIVTLLLLALMGMLAIVLDGGNGFFQRRAAQNAADAGALAGARELCLGNADIAVASAIEYAIVRNGAVEADATADANTGLVVVNTGIPFETTFGRVLGSDELTAGATATAGCFVPTNGEGVLPISWSCRAGDLEYNPEEGCNVSPYHDLIIMDSIDVALDHCQPVGNIVCDIDDPPDGRLDLLRGGDRSWLDLNGATNECGGGAAELSCWFENGYGAPVSVHTWAPEGGGVAVSIFQTAYDNYGYPGAPKWGKILLLPVFDYTCQGDPQEAPCTDWHGGDIIAGGTACPSGQDCFHIIAWSGFVITCVSDGPAHDCPLKDAAIVATDPYPDSYENNTKTIEGHFITGFIPNVSGAGGGAANAGLYTLFLIK